MRELASKSEMGEGEGGEEGLLLGVTVALDDCISTTVNC
jgi:hypothetical protein